MAKFLKVSFPEKCIGCELCVIEAQRQLEVIGLEGALIRVFKERKPGMAVLNFYIQVDPKINEQNITRIRNICPTGVFTIEQTEDEDGLLS